jgi:O-antigen/teichoic acid export membrane protein
MKEFLLRAIIPCSFIISKGSKLFAIYFLVSFVSPDEFAEWVFVSLFTQYSFFLQCGMPFSISREISIAFGERRYDYVSNIIINSNQIFIISSLLIPIIYFVLFGFESIFLISSYAVFANLSALIITQARSNFKNKKVAFSQIIEGLIVLFMLYNFQADITVDALIITFLSAAIFSSVFCMPSLKILNKSLNLFKINFSLTKELLISALPLAVFAILMLLRNSWDVIFISMRNIDGADIYVASQIFAEGMRIFIALLAMLYIPYLARSYGAEKLIDNQSIKRELNNFDFICFLTCVIGILVTPILISFILPIMGSLYESYSTLYILKLIAVITILPSIPRLLFLNTIRHPWKSNMILCITLIGCFIFVPIFNIYFYLSYSLCISIIFANILCFILSYSFSKQYLIK